MKLITPIQIPPTSKKFGDLEPGDTFTMADGLCCPFSVVYMKTEDKRRIVIARTSFNSDAADAGLWREGVGAITPHFGIYFEGNDCYNVNHFEVNFKA